MNQNSLLKNKKDHADVLDQYFYTLTPAYLLDSKKISGLTLTTN